MWQCSNQMSWISWPPSTLYLLGAHLRYEFINKPSGGGGWQPRPFHKVTELRSWIYRLSDHRSIRAQRPWGDDWCKSISLRNGNTQYLCTFVLFTMMLMYRLAAISKFFFFLIFLFLFIHCIATYLLLFIRRVVNTVLETHFYRLVSRSYWYTAIYLVVLDSIL